MIESYTNQETINRAVNAAARFFCGGKANPIGAACYDGGRALARIGKADRANRLVKGSKSPTPPKIPKEIALAFMRENTGPNRGRIIDEPQNYAKNATTAGTFAVVERREWSGEWRVRFETNPGSTLETPDQAGDRITAMLSERGARKISESCYWMAKKRGGYSTFATLTLTPEAREKLTHRHLVPAGEVRNGWLVPEIDPARAKQGTFAPNYSQENQHAEAAKHAAVAGPYAALHEDTGRPYTPVKPAWSWSLQREAGRFFEAANQMYRRGWQYKAPVKAGAIRLDDESGFEYTPIAWETIKVPGSRALYCVEGEDEDKRNGARFTRLKWWREPLDYLWVAEAPYQTAKCWRQDVDAPPVADEHGEMMTNPHLHLMMRWRVPYRHFRAWARRLERLWGHGFAHLEKIKDPQKAGSYVAKAAGYLCKAQGKSDQGEIRGNRYSISRRARAPGWMECERHQIGLMGWLMAEANEAWNRKHGPKIQRREKLKRELEAAQVPAQRHKIGQLLEQVRAEIETLPRVRKYTAIFKGDEQKERFFEWARGRGWTPERQTGAWLHQWRREQWRRRNNGRLIATSTDVADWFALADAGAVVCEADEVAECC